jgi:hypothetical protein
MKNLSNTKAETGFLPSGKTRVKQFTKILLLAIAAGICSTASAQKTMLNFYSAYVFDDQFEYYGDSYTYYDGTIKGGYQWGLGIEHMFHTNQSIELFYLRQDTHAPTRYQGGFSYQASSDNFPLDVNYVMLGSNRRLIAKSGKVEGYFGPNAGVGILELSNPSKNETRSVTKFAWGLKLGMDIALNPSFKLKLQTHMTSPVQSMGGGLFFGTGGAGAGLSFYSTVYQFAVGGGLVFVPGNKKKEPEVPNNTETTAP